MKAQVRILTGALAGHIEVFSRSYVGIGRHPASDLRFDPELDLEVSGRHAALLRQGTDWRIRDLESRNGTFVNGHRIRGNTKLDDTDQIKFGPDGPSIEFRLVPDGTPDGVVTHAPRAALRTPATAAPPRSTASGRREASTTERIRVEVRRQTSKHRTAVVILLGAVLVAAGTFVAYSQQHSAAQEREIAALQARTDSILRAADQAINRLQGQVQGLARALQQSQTEVQNLQAALTAARRAGDDVQVAALERQLADATQLLGFQQVAAQVDYRGIVDTNQRAVAMVFARFANGDVQMGTSFAVTTTGAMITNRHVVTRSAGSIRPLELGVQFADSDQFFPARLVTVADAVDLALIKTDIRAGVPAVRGVNTRPDTLQQGDPVAIIGFPMGTDLAMDMSARNRTIARTTFSAGSVSKILADNIQVDGYSAVGGSGSPVFDRNGEVIGVLYGSPDGTGGRIIYSVPSNHVISLLAAVDR